MEVKRSDKKMRIGNQEIGKQEVSIALMIIFALVAMFFLGYKLAYDKAVTYANAEFREMEQEFNNMNQLKGGIGTMNILNQTLIIPGGT